MKGQRHHSDNYHPKALKVVRVTRIKSQGQRSSTKDEQTASTTKETDIFTVDHSSSTVDLHSRNMKTRSIQEIKNDVDSSQVSHPVTEKHLVRSTNQVAPSPTSSLTEQQRDTTLSPSIVFSVSSYKVTPLSNPDLIPSQIGSTSKSISPMKQTGDDSKLSRLSIGNRRQLYTIGRENITEKRHQKGCLRISPFCRFILIFLAILLLLAVAVVPATLITLNKTTTTSMTSTTLTDTSTTGTSTTSVSTSSRSTASTSTSSTSTASTSTTSTSITSSSTTSTSTTSSMVSSTSTTSTSTTSTSTASTSTSSTSTTSTSTTITSTTDTSTSSTTTTSTSTSSTSTTDTSTSSTTTTSTSTSTTSTTDTSTSSTSTTSSSTSSTSTTDTSTTSTSTTSTSTTITSTTDTSTSSTTTTSTSTSTTSTTDTSSSSTSSPSTSTSSTSTSSVTSSTESTTSTTSSSSSSTSVSTTTTSMTTESTTSGASTITITSNICTSTMNGIQMLSNCYPCVTFPFYYVVVYNYTALSNTTRIAFAFLVETYYFAIDSVSVRDFAAPNTELLNNGGFETGDLTSWLYCNQNNGSIAEGVKSNFTYMNYTYYPQAGNYYYLGGSNISADYIIQLFSTQAGHQYTVKLAVMYPGTGNSTSANFFLGV